MKKSTYTVAFIVSTAVHVGALSSNLIHVSAESLLRSRNQPVRLHILTPSTPAQPNAFRESLQDAVPEEPLTGSPEIFESHMSVRSEDPPQDMTASNTSRVDAFEKEFLTTISPVTVYKDPAPSSEIMERPARVLEIENNPDENAIPPAESRKDFPDTRQPLHSNGSDPGGADPDHSSKAALASLPVKKPEVLESSNSESEIPAKIILTSKPSYPRYCRLHEEEGTTVLSVEVLSNGEMGRVDVVRSSGYRRLDQAAVKGIRNAELTPAVKGGKRVTSVKRIAITFDLED